MSKTPLNYWTEFAVDIPLGVVLIFTGLRHNRPGPVAVLFTYSLDFFFSALSNISFIAGCFTDRWSSWLGVTGRITRIRWPTIRSLSFYLP